MDFKSKILIISAVASILFFIIAILHIQTNVVLFIDFIFLGIFSIFIPYSIYQFFVFRKIKYYEEMFPDFLRSLSESMRAGLKIIQAIDVAARTDFGSLTPLIRKMKNQISWNVPLSTALRNFAHATNSKLIKHAMNILIEVIKTGGDVENIIDALATNMEENKEVENEKKAMLSQHIMMMYAIFFIFLGICVALLKFLIPMLEIPQTGEEIPLTALGATNPCEPCLETGLSNPQCFSCVSFLSISKAFGLGDGISQKSYYLGLFFIMILLQGIFSGLIAGQIAYDSVVGGIKHSLIMLLIGFISFILIVKTGLV